MVDPGGAGPVVAGRRPTMKDVALLAGVSLSTVSRVVNGENARPDLIARVQHAVGMLGYRRDLTASTLRRADRVSASIGLVVADVGNPFFAAVQRGVEEVARERGVLGFTGSSDEDPDRERELAQALAGRRVDGLIIVPTGHDQSYLLPDRQAGIAVTFVDRPPRHLDADVALSDNAGGTATAVRHLLAHGHTRIAFLGDRERLFTTAERLRGYRETLLTAGLGVDPALIRIGLESSAAAEAATRVLLGGPAPPTALVAGQNLLTVGAVQALRAAGRQHEVALVGFDDVPLAAAVDPGISVVAQRPVELGRRAAELLFARIDGDHGPSRTAVVPTDLVPRGSGELGAARLR
ncbi:MAG TPA: LacI family DNA-binding transcriptional regulator [Mycobacteriales bacterium]|jgi:LacI family transcriptional regulator|nr:LacI family DNA-binding transcriptional regulator [Mycobacteriales bacterium]